MVTAKLKSIVHEPTADVTVATPTSFIQSNHVQFVFRLELLLFQSDMKRFRSVLVSRVNSQDTEDRLHCDVQ